MSKFNNTDNNDLNLLFNATKWIINLYSELFELENADCKESIEYEEKVNELKRAIALEDSLYDKVNLEFLAASLYKNMNMFAHNRLAYDFMDILSMDDERLFVRRLIRKIVEKRELEKTPHGNLYGAAALEKAVKDDFVNSFLAILNQYINDENFSNIIQYFIKIKYNFSCVYSSVESDFLEHNFSIKPNLLLIHQGVASLNMINKDTLMSIKLTEIINVLNYFVNHLKSLEDLDFSETPTFASGIVAQVFLRTSFLLSFDDDSVREKIIKMYGMEEIKDKEIWDVQNPAEIIGTALNSYNLDRELPITITLNL